MTRIDGKICVCFIVVLATCGVTYAGFVDFDGWRASWDVSLDGLVQITPIGMATIEGEEAYVIQKTAQFTQPPDPVTGLVPEISIQFEQISPTAVQFIGISQENITNQSGGDWIEYTNLLTSAENNVFFNAALTAVSGGGGDVGFSSGPFVNAVFEDHLILDLYRSLRMFNGLVPDGSLFQPGGGADDGTLVIQIIPDGGGESVPPQGGGVVFHLTETPRVPEPTTLICLGLGGLALLSKKKRPRDLDKC